jgi:hypothetical protein
MAPYTVLKNRDARGPVARAESMLTLNPGRNAVPAIEIGRLWIVIGGCSECSEHWTFAAGDPYFTEGTGCIERFVEVLCQFRAEPA